MMKKPVCILTALLCLFCSGCGIGGEKLDPTKRQLYIGLYEGGLGKAWMSEIETRFEKKFPDIQVIVDPGKSLYDSELLRSNFSTYRQDVFLLDYVADDMFTQYKNSGYVEEISDVITEPLTEFGENESILDKMAPFLKGYYYKQDTAFALPWYQSGYQMVYDVQIFEEYELFKNKSGEWTNGLTEKSVGQDGKEGTFDDGLPVTFTEFFELLNRMISVGVTPVTWAGNHDYYFTSLLTGLFANYEGYEDFKLNYTLEGNDSDLGTVTMDDAYRLRTAQKGKEYALTFADTLINKGRAATGSDYFSSNTFGSSQDNGAAQREFLTSRWKSLPVAMIIEGTWWENESRSTFDSLAKKNGSDYAYGNRRYGMMPMPKADENIGEGNLESDPGNTMACVSGRSTIFVNATSPRKADAKKFLQFLHTDEALQIATGYTNTPRPYEYDMEKKYIDMMTPYGRSLWDSTKTADVVYDEIPLNEFLRSDGSKFIGYLQMFTATVSGHPYTNPAGAFLTGGVSVENYLNGMSISKDSWTKALADYRKSADL